MDYRSVKKTIVTLFSRCWDVKITTDNYFWVKNYCWWI